MNEEPHVASGKVLRGRWTLWENEENSVAVVLGSVRKSLSKWIGKIRSKLHVAE